MGNSLAIRYSRLRQRALCVDQHGLKTFSVLAQRIQEALLTEDQAGIVKLPGMQCGQVLAVPVREVGDGFCDLENCFFLWELLAEGGQRVAQPQARQEKTRLAGAAEGLGGQPAAVG